MGWIDAIEDYGAEAYIGAVLLFGLYVLVRVLLVLRATSTRRMRSLRARERMDAVETESPLANPTKAAQARGLDSIERNATVIRRLLIPLIVVATVGLAMLPMLSRVSATMVSGIVAIATVVLGVAARPLIENAMSGLVISFSRLVNIGDTVRVEEKYGTVEDISITHTTIKLWDWRRFIVPNSRMLQQAFINYSVHDKYQWSYVSFTISYEADLEKARAIALAIPSRSKHFADYEDPQFWIMELGPQGYEVWLAAWAETPSEAWYLRSDMREGLVRAFKEHGIPVQRMRHEVTQIAA
jgi:small-conductance mechanosensitive channel